MTSIIGVGDNTVDTYIHRRTRFPGGNAVNVAVLAHRYGARAAYLGFVGSDEGGQQVLDSLRAEGLDISHCHILQGESTGYSTVNVVDGDRVFGEGISGACRFLHLSQAELDYIAGFDIVHTSVFSYLEPQMAELKAHSKLLCFDLSQRCDAEYLDQVLPHSDIALLSLAEISDPERDALMNKMMAYGLKLLVMTRGKQGSWVYDGQTLYHQDIIPVETVDSLGAGDAFAARFLVEYVGGTPIQHAMELAAQSAAENCTHYGAYGYGKPY
jgi:fructoselysine 6-kinase